MHRPVATLPPARRATAAAILAALAVLAVVLALAAAAPARAQEAELRAALAHVAARDWDAAAAAARDAGPIAADIVEWHRLRAGEGRLGDYEAFLARRPDWPGLALLRQRGEAAVARSAAPDRVLAWFAGTAPATPDGALALARALRAAGRGAEAGAAVAAAWRDLSFNEAEEATFLAAEGAPLAAVHADRAERLLWQGRVAEARRMLPLLPEGARRVAAARIALREDAPGVDQLIAAVPPARTGDPGLAHARFDWRMRKGRFADAAALVLDIAPDALGRPEAWAGRRAQLARTLLREGDAGRAWRVAAGHGLTAGGEFADLEFLAGYIALRRLGEPDRARDHFRRLEAAVRTPISLSRALYWQGRAEEAAGRAEAARAASGQAARHQTAYYGLLAAERAGLPFDAALLDGPAFPDWRGTELARSSVLAAGLLLLQAGDPGRARQFLLHLAEGLDATALGQLSDLALAVGAPNIAVLVAKQAAERGVILPRAYFPQPDLVPEGLAVPRALALAVARRESEFDPRAISPADARGLMQLLPGTAEMMARELGEPYSEPRLLTDPAWNARLGAAYLAGLGRRFGPSVALVAAGYNAGPNRPAAWIGQIGDPRDPATDPVDWVELVPFSETRTYIMRVAEALVIYRARLSGRPGPVNLTGLLAGKVPW
jgi:soluble lytic murein transglycosylase